jgi:tetratricopeptide (TPR) repeat protein
VALGILASVYSDQGQVVEARKLYEDTLALLLPIQTSKASETQKVMNGLAWLLATAADPKSRDPARAVELAKEVVHHSPKFAEKWTTLGVAYYRAGDCKAAINALENSQKLAPGRFDTVNRLFLAMACWQLGDKENGRQWYTGALASIDKAPHIDPELLRFRAEAAKLLGMSRTR